METHIEVATKIADEITTEFDSGKQAEMLGYIKSRILDKVKSNIEKMEKNLAFEKEVVEHIK